MSILKKLFKKKEIKQTIQGDFADVSHWENVDFNLYDKKILITKCTEGVSNIDPTFEKYKLESKKKGLKFGAYHFYRNDKPVMPQVELFLKVAGNDCDFYILDLETMDGSSAVAVKQFAKRFLELVHEKTGKLPIIYSGHSFLVNLNLDDSFTKYPLWLARYTTIKPIAPAPWKDWLFWQYADNAPFKGIGECDGNVYNKDNGHGIKL